MSTTHNKCPQCGDELYDRDCLTCDETVIDLPIYLDHDTCCGWFESSEWDADRWDNIGHAEQRIIHKECREVFFVQRYDDEDPIEEADTVAMIYRNAGGEL